MATVLQQMCVQAKQAQQELAEKNTNEKNQALHQIALALVERTAYILEENQKDIEAAKGVLSASMIDRLSLSEKRIADIANAIEEIIMLDDPVGKTDQGTIRPNGLKIYKTRVPLGVIGIIYEARPNVTVDAAALCLKSSNAVILRGGKEAIHSNTALVKIMREALQAAQFNPDCINLVTDTSRASSVEMMKLNGYIDVLIPRGGAGLIRAVVENSTVPVIETGVGNCHVYVDETADLKMAAEIIYNAKCSRPSVCNAAETLLVHRGIAKEFLPMAYELLAQKNTEIRGCPLCCEILPNAKAADDTDFATEFGDYILAVRVVDDIDQAIAHIRRYSTGHSEAIVTDSFANSQKFTQQIDAAAVYVNASTRFTDGGEFGLGAEIGISTQKLHTRGPMGLNDLTTVKYIVLGNGQIR